MSSFFIFSIAAMTRFDFSGSRSCSIVVKAVGASGQRVPEPSPVSPLTPRELPI